MKKRKKEIAITLMLGWFNVALIVLSSVSLILDGGIDGYSAFTLVLVGLNAYYLINR